MLQIETLSDELFRIKTSDSSVWETKPKQYELESLSTTSRNSVTIKQINTGEVLCSGYELSSVEVNGVIYTSYEALSAALTPILFKKGGGSGSGAVKTINAGDYIKIDETELTKDVSVKVTDDSSTLQEIVLPEIKTSYTDFYVNVYVTSKPTGLLAY